MGFQIARVAGGLDRRSFERTYYRNRIPVVIEDAAPGWAALGTFDVEHLAARLEGKRVSVALSETATFREEKFERQSFRAFAQRMGTHDGPGVKAVAMVPIAGKGGLAEALQPPPAVLPVEPSVADLWVSPQSWVTVLHYDLYDALVVQVRGRKRWSLYDPRDWRRLYPRPLLDRRCYHSRVDIDSPDLSRFPAFSAACRFEATVEAGQAIFIPAPWWHQVYSLDDQNISVHYRWANWSPKVALMLPMLRQRLSDAYQYQRFLLSRWRRRRGAHDPISTSATAEARARS